MKPQVRVMAASMRIMHTCSRNPVLAKTVKSVFIVIVMNQRLSAHCTVLGSLLVVKITHNNMVKSKQKYQNHVFRSVQYFLCTKYVGRWINQCDTHPNITSPKSIPAHAGVMLNAEDRARS